MKYFIEDTTLTNIADAVREKEESTQPIPVLELAGRIRDIQSGAQLAVTLNEDGTQNLSILDDGKTFDLPSLTADADATPEDVAEGKVFYAKGYRYVGAGVKPTLLWTNASPTSVFNAQAVNVESGYDGYLVELAYAANNTARTVVGYCAVGNATTLGTTKFDNKEYASDHGDFFGRSVTANNGSVSFANGFYIIGGSYGFSADCAVPTRIWGVKFTL